MYSGHLISLECYEGNQLQWHHNLHVCDVDCGEKDYLTIVCGAPNVTPEMRTILAKVGAKLPGKPKLKSIKLNHNMEKLWIK